jgi:hypothetical protein
MAKSLKDLINEMYLKEEEEKKNPFAKKDDDKKVDESADEDEDKEKMDEEAETGEPEVGDKVDVILDPMLGEEAEEDEDEDKKKVDEEAEEDEDEDKKKVDEEADKDDMDKMDEEADDNDWTENDLEEETDNNAGLDDGNGGSKSQQNKQAQPGSGEKGYVDISKGLSEMFAGVKVDAKMKKQASTLFEAALSEKVSQIRATEQKKFKKLFAEAKAKTEKRVDAYLNYVIENWMKTNKLAVETGIRNEISENMVTGLHKLFLENHVEVPKDKYNLVKDLERQVQKLSEGNNKQGNQILQRDTIIRALMKRDAFREISEGLTVPEKTKFKALVSDVKFVNESAYSEKLLIIKQKHFGKATKKLNLEQTTDKDKSATATAKTADPAMQKYMDAITRTQN